METIKMITIDLDGTLLRSDGSVSDHTVETLQKARQKGVIVAIATGRMYQTAKAYGERLALGDSPMLLFAGGLIQTLESKKILFQQTVPRQDAQDLVSLARNNPGRCRPILTTSCESNSMNRGFATMNGLPSQGRHLRR